MMRQITKTQYLMTVGLLTLAKDYTRRLKDIEKSLLEITKEEAEYGHTMDAVYNNYTADELFEKLNISVQK